MPDHPSELGGGVLRESEIDQKNPQKRGQHKPRNHDHLNSQFAHGRNVFVDARITIEEAVAIPKDIGASNYIDDQEEGSRYSQSRKSHWVNFCQHNLGVCFLFYLFSSFWSQIFQKNFDLDKRVKNTRSEGVGCSRRFCLSDRVAS